MDDTEVGGGGDENAFFPSPPLLVCSSSSSSSFSQVGGGVGEAHAASVSRAKIPSSSRTNVRNRLKTELDNSRCFFFRSKKRIWDLVFEIRVLVVHLDTFVRKFQKGSIFVSKNAMKFITSITFTPLYLGHFLKLFFV